MRTRVRESCVAAGFASATFALSALLLVPSASAAQVGLGDPVATHVMVERVMQSVGDTGHLPAVVATQRGRRKVVLHHTSSGAWRAFSIGSPQAARLAMLEDGRELVAYDDGTGTVLVRIWAPDGTVGAAVPVLSGVAPGPIGESQAPGWQLSADRSGTVVVVARGDADHPGGIYAAVRDPDRAFRPPQELAPTDPTADDALNLDVSPIGMDGSVTVTVTGRHPGERLIQTRAGRSPVFTPAEAPPTTPPGLLADLRPSSLDTLPAGTPSAVTYADASTPVGVGAAVLRLCRAATDGCGQPQLFTWAAKAHNVIAFTTQGAGRVIERWWVATQRADGMFDGPRLATRDDGSIPVATATPGTLDFTRSGADAAGASHRGRLYLIPFGRLRLPPKPRISVDARAFVRHGRLSINAHCRDTCRLHLSVRPLGMSRAYRHGTVSRRQFGGTVARTLTLEPLEFATLTIPAYGHTVRRLRAVFIARDPEGRTAHVSRTLRRGRLIHGTRSWCVTPTPSRGPGGC